MAIISFWWDIGILLFILYQLALFWMRRKYKYWEEKGIKGPDPQLVVGNVKNILTLNKSIGQLFQDVYNKYKTFPYAGIYMIFRPTLVVNDLDLIKQLLIKDFNSFTDHLLEFNPKYEPLSEHLFNLNGERWRSLRQKLTPTFTSNKMRYMFDTLKDCTKELDENLGKVAERNEAVSVKDFLSKFGMNVIGSVAFGVECNTFEDPNSKFLQAGKALLRASPFVAIIRFIILFCYPEGAKNIRFSFIGKDTNKFFHDLVRDTIDYRNNNNIKRNDFLQLLMQLQEHGHVEDSPDNKQVDDGVRLTTMQLAAQCFVFFIAGFETSSTTASFALYELAMNPKIQDTLREDIEAVLAKNDGKITYESLTEMKYLTQVIEETLRKYPPVPMLIRKCTKEYNLPNTDIIIEKNTPVIIPTLGIHMDPQYYPDPEKFDPERFTPENKEARPHFSYIPFGEGPRLCIGQRFGLIQAKLGLLTIISKYKVSVSDKTISPMEFDPKPFLLSSKEAIWLKFTKI